ncbi:hypothetical protein AX14_005446 [Amanita brunnescens Koide BX004]|nr:hypothetical protein AX14_005446 [Amanita brunnescens Koide BX004]
MSRGDRAVASGNLSLSMRNNYDELGVDEYYKKVGATYRNPHYPGVRLCMFSWLSKWWQMEKECVTSAENDHRILLFDMACGHGEVTVAFAEWLKLGQNLCQSSQGNASQPDRRGKIPAIPVGPEFPQPYVMAADPYTSEAFKQRTGLSCDRLSFKDVAEGTLPSSTTNLSRLLSAGTHATETDSSDAISPVSEDNKIEMAICSFALHLVESNSELFALLWELSTKTRWLVVIAPHKKPEIKAGWGWVKWNVDEWSEGQMKESKGEFLHDRVHCRVYKSLNVC